MHPLRLLEFCDYARAEFRGELSHKRRIVRLAQKIKFQQFHAQNLTFLACLSYLLKVNLRGELLYCTSLRKLFL